MRRSAPHSHSSTLTPTSTLPSPTSRRRGGIAVAAMAALALAAAGTVAAFSFTGSGTTNTGGSATANSKIAKGERKVRPGEVAVVLHLLGIHPEGLAAAGFTGQACDALFDTGMVYCLQAERLDQLQIAHKNVNMASEKAVHPDAPGATDGQDRPITLEQAHTALADLESAGFTFVTANLDPGIASKLATIKANQHWGLPSAYLIVNRSDEQWLALRGALCARRYANQHGLQLEPALVQILADAEGDPTVAQALVDAAGGLGSVTQSWSTHEVAP
jgi:hypothetical protein